jgi:hypothetical protein
MMKGQRIRKGDKFTLTSPAGLKFKGTVMLAGEGYALLRVPQTRKAKPEVVADIPLDPPNLEGV